MRLIVIGVALGVGSLAACTGSRKGDSETHWLTCDTDHPCPSGQACVATQCTPSDGSVRTGSDGAGATGGSAGGSGGLGVTRDASIRDGALALACTEAGAWTFGAPEPVGGAGYSEIGGFGREDGNLAVAGDGSAFVTWAATDSTNSNVHTHASRYTSASGWVPHLNFDEYPQMLGGTVPDLAASANGEAMVVWIRAIGVDGGTSYTIMAMRYASGWEAPVELRGPTTDSVLVALDIAADAHGDFIAAWREEGGPAGDGTVRTIRYASGSGWGPTEIAAPPGPGSASAGSFGHKVLVNPAGHALVTWSQTFVSTGAQSINAKRFDPNAGWSGSEILVEGVLEPTEVSTPYGAIGDDGTAAVTWTQVGAGMTRVMVRTFSGSWSATTNLDGVPTGETGWIPAIATDSHGAFIVVWEHSVSNQLYASRITPGGSWSPKTLLNTAGRLADGAPTGWLAPYFYIAMSRTGDALVSFSQDPNTWSVHAVTFSPSSGWSAPTRLDERKYDISTPPVMDACGNGTLVWLRAGTADVMAARHLHGGSWTSPSRLGTTRNSFNYQAVGLVANTNGETIASFRAQDDHGLLASVLK